MAGSTEKASPARPRWKRLAAVGSDLGRQIERNRDLPLRTYLRNLIPARPAQQSIHLDRLVSALASELHRRGHPAADDVCDYLRAVPIIQQADHAHLLLDQETFLNNYLFALACREAGSRFAITLQCTTVSCLSRRTPVGGPVFLRTRGGLYDVFGLSRRRYKDASFCALPPSLTMVFRPLENSAPLAADDRVLGGMFGRRLSDPADGYRRCNDEIWGSLGLEGLVRRVQVDSALVSEIVARHLEDPSGPVYQLIFEPTVRDAFLRIKRDLVAGNINIAVNRAEPDFLWCRKGERLVPVVLRGHGQSARFELEVGEDLPMAQCAASVAKALRTGDLYADRIITYLVTCLLPGVVALGGTSQQDYVTLYQRMIAICQDECGFMNTGDAARVCRPSSSRLGGAPLLELDHRGRALLAGLTPHSPLEQFAQEFMDRTVEDSVGSLACAAYFDPTLAKLEGLDS